jgi:hypothetical protein
MPSSACARADMRVLRVGAHAFVFNEAIRFCAADAQFPAHHGALGKNWLLKFREECPPNCHFLLRSAYTQKK